MTTNSELSPGFNSICIHGRRTLFFFQSRNPLPGKIFGFIRRNSFSDDRLVRAIRLIARGLVVADVMHELTLNVKHRRRDNVGGVVISGNPPEFTDTKSERIFQSLIHISSLEYYDSDPDILLSLHEIKGILRGWCVNDRHYDNDQAYKATFSGKIANSRTWPRYIRERDKLDSTSSDMPEDL
jgi:hypothetical protein